MRRFKSLQLLVILSVALAAGALLSRPAQSGEKKERRQLAVLIAIPDPGEWAEAVENDRTAVYAALRKKGYRPEEILSLNGPVTRRLLQDFLADVGRRVADWPDGSVFLHYTGSGHWRQGDKGAIVKTGLELGKKDGQMLLWEEVFQTLNLPRNVRLTVLPDCCYTGSLAGHVPPNVAALILKAQPGEARCRADYHVFDVNGRQVKQSIITHYAVQALEEADTLGQWQERVTALVKADVEGKRLPEEKSLPLAVAGSRDQRILAAAK